jgi:hypothetical protein
MSIAALAWAFKVQDISSPAKFVLIALADAHNGHTGDCFPRAKRLMSTTLLGESTIRKAMKELESAGLLSREIIVDEDGRTKGVRYTLGCDDVGATSEPPGAPTGGGRGPVRQVGGATSEPSYIKNNRKEETGKNNQDARERAFSEVFWPSYPHQVGMPVARKAFFSALKKVDLETLMAGLEAYKQTKPDNIAWCNPATWLNQERWADQPSHINPTERNMSNAERTREALKRTVIKHFGEPCSQGGGSPWSPGGYDAGRPAIPLLPSYKRS